MRIKKQFKRGIAMIELIFALVIMGIALLSAPILIQQSIQSSNVVLQQESIAALASHTGILLSKHWDEGDANLTAGVAPIITLNNPVGGTALFSLDGVNMNDTNVSGRTSTISGNAVLSSLTLGQEGIGDFNDIDDYNNIDINLTIFNDENATIGSLGDYIDKDINILTNISFADDQPDPIYVIGGELRTNLLHEINASNNIFATQSLASGTDSNIKFVKTTLTTSTTAIELQKNIVLRAFSCNLGTYSLGGIQY